MSNGKPGAWPVPSMIPGEWRFTFAPKDEPGWPAYLETVRIGGALPVWFVAGDVLPSGAESVTAYMQVPALDTGRPLTIRQTFALPPFDVETAPRVLFDIAAHLYRHELKEQMRIGDERAFDPHEEHEPW